MQPDLPKRCQGRLFRREGIGAGALWVCRSLLMERAFLVKVLAHGKAWWFSLGIGKAAFLAATWRG